MSHFLFTRQLIGITLIIGFLGMEAKEMSNDSSIQVIKNELLLEEALRNRFTNPDSAIYLLEMCYQQFLGNQDTTKAIFILKKLAVVNGNQANYVASYNVLWKALLLAEAARMPEEVASIYRNIGRYYSFYKRKEDALKYFQLSLNLNKILCREKEQSSMGLMKSYFAFCSTYRELDEPQIGKRYLDSCYQFLDPHHPQGTWYQNHLQFEKAFILNKEKKYQEALASYQEIIPWFEANLPSYGVLVFTYMGDVYTQLGQLNKGENAYQKALNISANYHSHIDFTPLIHERLASLNIQQGNYQAAFASLHTAKELDARFFDSRSKLNRPLFEIQDAYRQEKKYQKELLQKQRFTELEHKAKVSMLQKIILVGSLVLLLLLGLWYLNYVQQKHKTEKLRIQQKQEMEIQKANELVELKNKQLAASALKLIEKDELFSSLKDKLKEGNGVIPTQELKHILKSNSVNNARNWKEFEARFIAVNGSFYETLSNRFPQLTQADQKLCALIKLNFNSKEMAKLLGISVESVHTSRYRLRKKLGITRAVNLTEFIGSL